MKFQTKAQKILANLPPMPWKINHDSAPPSVVDATGKIIATVQVARPDHAVAVLDAIRAMPDILATVSKVSSILDTFAIDAPRWGLVEVEAAKAAATEGTAEPHQSI